MQVKGFSRLTPAYYVSASAVIVKVLVVGYSLFTPRLSLILLRHNTFLQILTREMPIL